MGRVGLSTLLAGSVCLSLVMSSLPAGAASLTTGSISKPKLYKACACDYAGASVAISGTTAVVGVPGIDDAAGRAYIYTLSGTWVQTAELTASDAAAGDTFGASVSLSGTTAIVGAPGHSAYAGSAYVFSASGGTWSQTAELQASDSTPGAWFGASVAVDGSNAIVGAPASAGTTGSAYMFTQSGGAWPQAAEFTGPLSQDYFGYAVAVSGTSAIVGAPGIPTKQGNAYVFALTGGVWTQAGAFSGTGGGVHDFGSAVAINGTVAVVGAWFHTGGAAYIFTSSGGTWTMAQVFPSDNRAGFGAAVATSGTSVAVSAVGSSGNGGRAYVYNVVGSTWTQTAEFVHSGREAGDFFGSRALSISGSTIIVGAPAHGTVGDAFVFALTSGSWTQVADLSNGDSNSHNSTGTAVAASSASVVAGSPGHDGMGRAYLFPTPPPYHPVIGLQGADTVSGDNFGASLGMSGTDVIAGAPTHAGRGSAYIFTETLNAPFTQAAVRAAPLNNYVYEQPAELLGADTAAGDDFGASVAISGTIAVVGAPGHAGGGRAYVFTESGGVWTQVAELQGSDTVVGDSFGTSVSVSGTTAVVGAPGHTGGGAAYVFSAPVTTWSQVAELHGSDSTTGDGFGASVSIDGTNAVVGAPGHTGGGEAYIFSAPASTWTQVATAQGSDTVSGDNFGNAVAISGTTVVVGAPGHLSGRAYAFSQSGSAWPQTFELTVSGSVTGDGFGSSVAISGTTAVVGGPHNGGTGSASVFAI
jgi:FG-GAP repeat